jgi:signal transduction histidine kinase
MRRLWDLTKRYWFDGLLVALVGVGILGMVVSNPQDRPELPLWLAIPVFLAIVAPLFARRRFPFGAPAATVVVGAIVSFVDANVSINWPAGFLAYLSAAFLFALGNDRREALAGLAISIATIAIITFNEDGAIGDGIAIGLLFGVAWVVGFTLNRNRAQAAEAEARAARAEREREERARAAVAEDRARIARELHDVVGHSVSVMTVQAGAVRRLLKPEQEREREALLVVEQTGREALAEMRRMVGVLRHPEEAPALAPQPGLEQLERLVAQAREAGLPVELRVEGERRPLPPGIDLAAYRAVQEGLTNTRKHAEAERVEVVVRYGDDRVNVTVADDGSGRATGHGRGHGLVGMRERIALYGGELDAGPRAEGGYELRVSLPLDAAV